MPPIEPKVITKKNRQGEGGGRPVKPMDIAVIERAASIGCSPEEIAALCQVSRTTFFARIASDPALADAVERGRDQGRATLRRMQWQAAQNGNPAMLIWLGKQLLGQRDKQEISGDADQPIVVTYRWAEPPPVGADAVVVA